MTAIFHLYPLILASLGAAAIYFGGWWPIAFIGWLFVGDAAIDALLPNRIVEKSRGPSRDTPFHVGLVALAFPLQGALLVYGLYTIAYLDPSVVEVIGITLLLGTSGGALGIVAAHELVHRREGWLRGLGIGILLMVNNPQFRLEHVYNHHKNVGTPRDPATARLGESVYAFVPRSIVGQFLSAWKIEAERLERRKQAPYGIRNRMLQYVILMALVNVGVAIAFGWAGLAVFLIQSYIAMNALEIINYIEHYGLERREIAPGKYEPFGPQHAWNSAHFVTDFGLFKLGRHSAHHLDAHLPYPDLYNNREMPQLPTGYAGSYILAMAPPLWRRIMDPKVEAIRREHEPVPDAVPAAAE